MERQPLALLTCNAQQQAGEQPVQDTSYPDKPGLDFSRATTQPDGFRPFLRLQAEAAQGRPALPSLRYSANSSQHSQQLPACEPVTCPKFSLENEQPLQASSRQHLSQQAGQPAQQTAQLRFSAETLQKGQLAKHRYSADAVDTPGASACCSLTGSPEATPVRQKSAAEPGHHASIGAVGQADPVLGRPGRSSVTPAHSSSSTSQPQMGTPSLRSRYSSNSHSAASKAHSGNSTADSFDRQACHEHTATSWANAGSAPSSPAPSVAGKAQQPIDPPHQWPLPNRSSASAPASPQQTPTLAGRRGVAGSRQGALGVPQQQRSSATVRGFLAARSAELRAAIQQSNLQQQTQIDCQMAQHPDLATGTASSTAQHEGQHQAGQQKAGACDEAAAVQHVGPQTPQLHPAAVQPSSSLPMQPQRPGCRAPMTAAAQAKLLRNRQTYVAQFRRRMPQLEDANKLLRCSADTLLDRTAAAAAQHAQRGNAPAPAGCEQASQPTMGAGQQFPGMRKPASCPVTPSKPMVSKARKPSNAARPGLGYRNSAVPARQVITAQLPDFASMHSMYHVSTQSANAAQLDSLPAGHPVASEPPSKAVLTNQLPHNLTGAATSVQHASAGQETYLTAPLAGISAATQARLAAAVAESPARRAESALARCQAAAITARAEERMQDLKALICAHQQKAAQHSMRSSHSGQRHNAYNLEQQVQHDVRASWEASQHAHTLAPAIGMAVTKPSGPTREAHTAAHALLQGLTETWPGDELLPAKCRSLLPRLCRMVALRAATLEAASPAEKQVYDLSQHGRVAPSFDLWEDTSQPSKPGGSIRSRAAPARLSDSFSQVTERRCKPGSNPDARKVAERQASGQRGQHTVGKPRPASSTMASAASSSSSGSHSKPHVAATQEAPAVSSTGQGRPTPSGRGKGMSEACQAARVGTKQLRRPPGQANTDCPECLRDFVPSPFVAALPQGAARAAVASRNAGRLTRPAAAEQPAGSTDSILAIAEWDLAELCDTASDAEFPSSKQHPQSGVRTSHASVQELLSAERSAAQPRRAGVRDSAESEMFRKPSGAACKAAQQTRSAGLSGWRGSAQHVERAAQAAQHALRQAGLDELQHDMVQCIFLRETSGDAQDGQPRSLTSSPVKSLLERSKPSEREYAVIGKLELPRRRRQAGLEPNADDLSGPDSQDHLDQRQPVYLLAAAARRYEQQSPAHISASEAAILANGVDTAAAASGSDMTPAAQSHLSARNALTRPARCGCWAPRPKVEGSPGETYQRLPASADPAADDGVDPAAYDGAGASARLDSDEHMQRRQQADADSKALWQQRLPPPDAGTSTSQLQHQAQAEQHGSTMECQPRADAEPDSKAPQALSVQQVQRQAGESAAASLRNTLGRFSVRSTSPAGAPMSDCCKAATDTEDCATTSNGRQPRQDAQPGVSGQWAQDMAARSYSQAAAGSVGAVSASGPHSPPVHESDAQPNPQEDPRRQQENCTVGQMLGDSWNVIASLADEGSFTMPDLAPRRHASFSVKAAGREALRSLRVSADNLFGRHVTIRGHLTRPRQGLAGTSGDDFATHWSKRQPEDRLTEFENSPLHLGLINPYR